MKKKLITIGIIVIALIAIFIIWLLAPTPASESIQNMVLENEPDYTITALIYYKDYQQQDADVLKYSTVTQTEGTYVIICYPELFNIRKIILSDTDGTSGMVVCDSYYLDKQPWSGVYAYDGFVSFGNFTGRESLVYSIDGTRPSYVNCPYENFERIWVHKITDNWYHVRGE